MIMSVCLLVSLPVYLRNYLAKRQQIFMHTACSIVFWRRCDTLCSSGFVDDVIVSHNALWCIMYMYS